MKKLLAVLLCVIALFSIAVPAMAIDSPEGEQLVNVTVATVPGTKNPAKSYKVKSIINAEADPNAGTFDSWTIYRPDGSLAVEGTDYKYITGSAKATSISIEVSSDLIVCANYNGKGTDPITGDGKKQPDSPKTGEAVAVYATVLMLAGAAFTFAKKKCAQ